MVILDKYIFKGFIFTFLFCVIILWVFYIIGDVFGFLDEILREGIPASSLIDFYINLTPFIIIQIMPVSILIACVFILGNLNRQNEVTAMRASGISIWEMLRPMLICAFVVSLFVFIINDKILPNAMRRANRIRYEELDVGKRGKDAATKVKKVALYGEGNRIIYAAEFDIDNNILKDVIIHQHGLEHDLVLKISAKEMRWNGFKWVGEDVVIYKMNNKGEFIGDPTIAKTRMILIDETPTDFINYQWKPEYMSFGQLKKYTKAFATGSKKTYRSLLVDLNYKIAFPFTCMITILISAPFTLSTRRGGALVGMAKGIIIAVAGIPTLMAFGLALAKGGTVPPFLGAWLSNIVFGGIGIYFINRY